MEKKSLNQWVTYETKSDTNTFASNKRNVTDKDPVYAGKKKKLEIQGMDKWMKNTESTCNSDEWKP